MKASTKKLISTTIKIGLAIALLTFVFFNIELKEVYDVLKNSNKWYILLCIILYILSQWLSAERLYIVLQKIGLQISKQSNRLLYLQGMFYNLFIPGGVGGDGYKVYMLNKHLKWPLKMTTATLLADRVTGLFAMVMLILIGGLFIPIEGYNAIKNGILALCIILALIALPLGIRWIFPSFRGKLNSAILLSFVTQGIQILCLFSVLKSLHIEDYYLAYSLVLLVSGILSILSFSGLGIREMVFLKAVLFFPDFEQNVTVSIGIILSLITTFVSLIGIVTHFSPNLIFSEQEKALAAENVN